MSEGGSDNSAVKIVAIIGGVIVVIVVSCGVLGYFGIKAMKETVGKTMETFEAMMQDMQQSQATADKFLTEIQTNNLEGAYESTTEAFKKRMSKKEFDELVAKHPAVMEVAAVPVTSELSEDEVMIYVVCREGHVVSEEDLVRFANRNMAHFMVPRFVHFIDALPKTASEKIEKYKLKTWAEQNRMTIWDREAVGLKLER